MKTLFLLLAMMLLSVSMVVAQDAAPANPPADQNQAQPDDRGNVDVDADANQSGAAVSGSVNTQQEQDAAGASGAPEADDAAALPQTASPLPLLGLLGMGSLAAGVISRRK